MATEAPGPSTAAPPPRPAIADARGWRSLGIVGAIALFTTLNWPGLIWLWGSIVVLLFLRAGAIVLAARAAGDDPEAAHLKRVAEAAANPDR